MSIAYHMATAEETNDIRENGLRTAAARNGKRGIRLVPERPDRRDMDAWFGEGLPEDAPLALCVVSLTPTLEEAIGYPGGFEMRCHVAIPPERISVEEIA